MLLLNLFAVAGVYLTRSVLCVTPLKLDFEIHRGNSLDSLSKDNSPFFSKRDTEHGGVELTLENDIASYVATIKVGSNQQELSVLVSVSESDTWVISKEVKCLVPGSEVEIKRGYGIDEEPPTVQNKEIYDSFFHNPYQSIRPTGTSAGNIATSNTCTDQGSFETSGSNSYVEAVEYSFFEFLEPSELSVLASDSAIGVWGNDSMSIGGANISHFVFGIANVTNLKIGRLGLGFPDNEYHNEFVPSLPLALKNQKVINRAAYSLYINSLDAPSGSILLGAVDHAKYTGDLTTFPMMPPEYTSDYYPDVSVPLTSIDMNFDTGATAKLTNNAYAVSFDTTVSMSTFPSGVYQRLIELLGGKYDHGFYSVPCPSGDSSVTLDFNFNGAIISVPLTSLIVTDNTGRYSQYYDSCTLAISGESQFVLGQDILRHGYFVFDLEGKSISIAQVKFTDEEDIEMMSDSIPGAVRGSSTSLKTSMTPSEPNAQSITYSTGSFSGRDYMSTRDETNIYTHLESKPAPTQHSVSFSSHTSSRRSRNEGANIMNDSLFNSISAAFIILLTYISLV